MREYTIFWCLCKIYRSTCVISFAKFIFLQILKVINEERMKKISIQQSIATLLLGGGLLCGACGEDRTKEFVEKTERCQWIYDIMTQWYLWVDEMPTPSETQFFGEPETFFKKLIVKQDKYSYMENTGDDASSTRAIDLRSSYGMDFALYIDPVTQSQSAPERVARVLYVLPGSPADVAGIKRGQWITGIGDAALTTENYFGLINGPATTLVTSVLNYSNPDSLYWQESKSLALAPSRHMEDNPFYVDTVYQVHGRRIAYLMYNRFSTGPEDTGNETQYNSQMCSIFQRIKAQEPTDFILDLRYNPGGYLKCAQVLASLMAPADAMGKIFCKLEFNDIKSTNLNEVYLFDEKLTSGAGLGLSRVYIITSSLTASASESIINGLNYIMGKDNVILVGSQTEGKNVASLSFSSPYGYIIHPIVATVYNGNSESDYANGFAPNVSVDELQSITPFYPLGDVRELMLNTTLSTIISDAKKEETRTIPFSPMTLSTPEVTSISLRPVVEM